MTRSTLPLHILFPLLLTSCSDPTDFDPQCFGGKCDSLGESAFDSCPSYPEARDADYDSVAEPGQDPEDYEAGSAQDKRARLWELSLRYAYPEGCYPTAAGLTDAFRNPADELVENLIPSLTDRISRGMGPAFHYLGQPGLTQDEMQEGRRKFLHPHGSLALGRLEISGDDGVPRYQGVLAPGSTRALVRFSLGAGNGTSGSFGPGIAIKLFRDGQPTVNLHLMNRLLGQSEHRRYFARELPISNRLAIPGSSNSLHGVTPDLPDILRNFAGDAAISAGVAALFNTIHRPAHALGIGHLGIRDRLGRFSREGASPYQLFMVATQNANDTYDAALQELEGEAGGPVDFRAVLARFSDEFDRMSPLYEVWAIRSQRDAIDDLVPEEALAECQRPADGSRARCERIGSFFLDTEIVASAFGDFRLWFRHNHERARLDEHFDNVDTACEVRDAAGSGPCHAVCQKLMPSTFCEAICDLEGCQDPPF